MATYTQDYTRLGDNKKLLRSMLGQNMQPIQGANLGTALGKILTSYFLAKGMGEADRGMTSAMQGQQDSDKLDMSRALGAYREDTPHDYDRFPGEAPIEGLKDIGTGQNRDAMVQSMMGANNPAYVASGLNALLAQPKDSRPEKQKLYEEAVMQGYEGTLFDFLKATGSKALNINNIPTPSPGWDNVYDDQNRLISQKIIPGGPADIKAKEKEAEVKAAEEAQVQSNFLAETKKTEMLAQIDKARENNTFWTTGMLGKISTFWSSSDARYQEKLLERIQGEVALDRLSQAQQASKTGGVFGSLQKAELELLKNSIAALEVGMSKENMELGLNEIRDHIIKFDAAMKLANDFEYSDLAGFGKWDDNAINPETGEKGGIELLNDFGEIIGYYR